MVGPVPEDGPVTRPVAVLLAGAGSSADFVRRAFGPALADHEVVAAPPVPGAAVVSQAWAALDAAARRYGPRLRLVGGVSLGAHIATRWAAQRLARPAGTPTRTGSAAARSADRPAGGAGGGLAGVMVAFPAWTGAPGDVAAATGAAAAQVERLGVAGALAAARSGGVEWVADELAAAWPAYGDLLAPTLRAAAASPGPSAAELAALDLPVGLVACGDDPLHPLAVAERWAALLPRAALTRLHLADLAPDRALLGHAARAALGAATEHTARPLSTPPTD